MIVRIHISATNFIESAALLLCLKFCDPTHAATRLASMHASAATGGLY